MVPRASRRGERHSAPAKCEGFHEGVHHLIGATDRPGAIRHVARNSGCSLLSKELAKGPSDQADN